MRIAFLYTSMWQSPKTMALMMSPRGLITRISMSTYQDWVYVLSNKQSEYLHKILSGVGMWLLFTNLSAMFGTFYPLNFYHWDLK
jgi:hypothetical protein